jgi:hypothetical protein
LARTTAIEAITKPAMQRYVATWPEMDDTKARHMTPASACASASLLKLDWRAAAERE